LEFFKLPFLEQLIPDGIKAGSILLVEYDPESQWPSLATTLTARYVMSGFNACYCVCVRSREDARSDLSRLGLNVDKSEQDGLLRVDDWYSASLSLERGPGGARFYEVIGEGANSYVRVSSMKVSDLSVEWLKLMKEGHPYIVENWPPGHIIVIESVSPMLRFNEEKTFLDWLEARLNPYERSKKRIELQGIVRGAHSEPFYKRMESASDGVIEIRVMERGEEVKNLLRVRSMKGQPHDSRWHEIQIKPNGEATVLS
jgi:KaiC/GvpD/RAD55 family RecA-like ATPase